MDTLYIWLKLESGEMSKRREKRHLVRYVFLHRKRLNKTICRAIFQCMCVYITGNITL